MITLKYISHGDIDDGGYRHEKYFAESLRDYFSKSEPVKYSENRKWKLYHGLANLNLLFWGLFSSNADYNVVAARLGLSSWMRNLLNKNRTFIVVHDYDKNRYNSFWLRLYYPILFKLIKWMAPKRLKMVVISDYWVNYFQNEWQIDESNLFLFPNLLKTEDYLEFRGEKKAKRIHLGQESRKNSKKVIEFAEIMNKRGYECYFSSLYPVPLNGFSPYTIKYFENFDDYLKEMAGSVYTMGFSRFHEGWNRVVHESALVGTPVIAFKKGGMQQLVEESDNELVDSMEEAIELIERRDAFEYTCSEEFRLRYDQSRAEEFIEKGLNSGFPSPLVSVLVPVYNGQKTISKCIESVLSQTYSNWELILMDDASDDDSVGEIEKCFDPRITLIRNAENLGIAKSRNKLTGLANGNLIAWLDADDYMMPDRLSAQVHYMLEHSEIEILGTSALLRNYKVKERAYYPDHNMIHAYQFFKSCTLFPTIMTRNFYEKDENKFDEAMGSRASDYEWVYRLGFRYKIANFPEALSSYYVSDDVEYEDKKSSNNFELKMLSIFKEKTKSLGLDWEESSLKELHYFIHPNENFKSSYENVLKLLKELKSANDKVQLHSENEFNAVVLYFIMQADKNLNSAGFFALIRRSFSFGLNPFWVLLKNKSFHH
jgi:glycosyltransferase involved in cell wall biosynthesis